LSMAGYLGLRAMAVAASRPAIPIIARQDSRRSQSERSPVGVPSDEEGPSPGSVLGVDPVRVVTLSLGQL